MNEYEWNCEEIMRKWETNVEKKTWKPWKMLRKMEKAD